LITSKNLWSYGDGGTYDITDPAKAFYFTELFPAIKVKELFNTIENQFNLTFTSDFLSNDRFTNLFLWLKNQEIQLDNTNVPIISPSIREKVLITDTQQFAGNTIFDADNDTARLVYNPNYVKLYLFLTVTSVTSSDEYFVDVYMNGNLINSITTSGTGDKYVKIYTYTNNTYGDWIDEKYEFYIRSKYANTIETDIKIRYEQYLVFSPFDTDNISTVTFSTFNFDITQYLPDIKITDFISGILKQFNLTCVATSDTNYIIEPLDAWYGEGNIYDITQYTDTDSIDIGRVELYKAINFTHQQSQSFINRAFFAESGYEYGDIRDVKDFDGGDYNIELPFENLLFSKLNYTIPTNVQVGYCLNQEYNDYVPKPILLYKYTWQDTDVDINITDGINTFNLTSYQPFGQDVRYGSQDISLNWSTDNSSLLEKQMDFNSYSLYYQSYLLNLYNKKNRITTIKTNLPLSILTRLKLNDRLVIRDKRYIINDYQADLTSGDVQFKLLNDFRFIDTLNWQNDPEEYPNIAG
jgi:hypothetical protein